MTSATTRARPSGARNRGTGRTLARAALLLLVVGLLAPSGRAQLHEDSRHGIKFKPPKEFNSVALNPMEWITIAKYQAESPDYGNKGMSMLHREFEIDYYPAGYVEDEADDEDEEEEEEAEPEDEFSDFEKKLEKEVEETEPLSPVDQAWRRIEGDMRGLERLKEKKIKVGRDRALSRWYAPLDADGNRRFVRVWFAVLEQDDGVFVFSGNGFDNDFKKNASEYEKALKSFKRIEKDGSDTGIMGLVMSQVGDQERFLQEQIDKLPPDWGHLRTDRYLLLFNADEGFVKELADRIEAMRDVFEEMYPPDKPIEAVSIVRVCNSREEYMGYGGRAGSGGYWSSYHKELVFFDMRPRADTMAIANHEAFHQYIYYFYGELAPHSWYNEGHGDYFAGADMTRSNRIKSFGDAPGGIARMMTAKDACRRRASGETGPRAATHLKDLLRYSQGEYYNNGLKHYAQGWAVVHMLREGKGLEDAWESILDDYLQNLLDARDEVAEEEMEKFLADKEDAEKGSTKEMSRDPKDYYYLAGIGAIQNLAYEKTFGHWSDDDWEEFNDFYLRYVEKL